MDVCEQGAGALALLPRVLARPSLLLNATELACGPTTPTALALALASATAALQSDSSLSDCNQPLSCVREAPAPPRRPSEGTVPSPCITAAKRARSLCTAPGLSRSAAASWYFHSCIRLRRTRLRLRRAFSCVAGTAVSASAFLRCRLRDWQSRRRPGLACGHGPACVSFRRVGGNNPSSRRVAGMM